MTKRQRRYKLIANPHAGRGKANLIIADTVRLLNARGVLYELEKTKGPNDAEQLARAACESDDVDVLVSIGGDGTLNEIVQEAIFTHKPIAVIPAGSGNDFSRMLNTPKGLPAVVDMVLRHQTKSIDAGKMNHRYFANGVGIGFDAAVNFNTRSIRFIKTGLAIYFLAFLKTLNRYKPCPMKITINSETIEQEMLLVSVGNGTTCGGGFKLTPHALIDDGMLDITMVKPLSLPKLFWHLPKVFLGTIEKTEHAITRRTARLTIRSEHPLPIQVDGEVYALEGNPCEISVVPKALTVIGNFDSEGFGHGRGG